LRRSVTYCLCWFLLFSCKREISINIPDKASILVVDAALYNDSFISVSLSRTQNITDNSKKKYVENATIEVFNKDSIILDVLSHTSNGLYLSSSLKAKSKDVYIFKISYEGNTYWSNDRVPDSIKCIVQDTARVIFSGKPNFFQFNLKIDDIGLQKNFYGLKVKRYYKEIDGTDTLSLDEWCTIQSVDLILTEDPQTKFSNKHVLFKDVFFNGTQQFIKFGIPDLFVKQNQITTSLELFVSSYSENAFNYYNSVNEHLFYQNDPFSQPTLIKGNIQGAFGGIVAEYTQKFAFSFK